VSLSPLTYDHYVRRSGPRRIGITFRDIQSVRCPLKWSCYV
jgi:hypothetical protein